MRKFTILLSLLFVFIASATASVIKLSDFDQNKCYTVTTTTRGGWLVKADGNQFCSTNDAGFGTTTDATKAQNRFAVLTIDNENYYLFSIHANKFIKKDRTLVSGPGDPLEFADAGDGERVRVNFKNIVNSYINLGGSNQMTIDGWSTMDEGNRVKFTEVGDFDPAEALEMLRNPEVEVVNYFSATTIADGEFAQGTVWYTMQIAANGYVIGNQGDVTNITLEDMVSDITNEAQLWAFVGDNGDGYKLYNKQTGTSKVLAAPTTMKGQEGGTSYPILVDADKLPEGYTDLWLFTPSEDLGSDDTYFYMYEKGFPGNIVNNRNNILAFWSGGADAGSTLNIRFAKAEYPINTNAGEWTASNSAGTWASAWQSTNVPHVALIESQGRNNMAKYNNAGDIQLYTCLPNASVNGVHSATYMVKADAGYAIESYRFDFVSSGTYDLTITPAGGEGVTANSTEAKSVSATGDDVNSLSFTLTSMSNMFANTSNFYATIVRSSAAVEESKEIFVTKKNAIPYRIPAIAMANNGDLIAVADYRHSGSDIGVVYNGRIDLHARISNDNGATWNEKFDIVTGQGAGSPDFMHVGFGDPCIVADRESDRVLVLSCAGNVSFPNGTRNNHQNIARFYSDDNGAKWSEPVDIADEIYAMWDNSKQGPVMAMFIGSGKIHQSRYVKVNDYYRLYCAVLLKNRYATYTNFVLYSDDFGGSWDVLGGVETAPIPDGADEPKVEELPNGNIIISSRCNGGRHFNIFTFTDAKKAEGSWGNRATSNSNVNGVVALNNSCNGEILIVPAVRNEDKENVWIALQSLPFGSGRTNVGIYYKELASEEDYNTPDNFAKYWDGRHQASMIGSAYSTMCLQKDSTIAFLYEESTYGADYTILYKNYSLETITDSAYSILPFTVEEEEEDDTETFIPTSITPADNSTVGNLTQLTLSFAPEYPGRISDSAIIKVTDESGANVTIGKPKWNTSAADAIDIIFEDIITDEGKYTVTIPSYTVFSMDWLRCNPEIILNYTISRTGIAEIESVKVNGEIYDLGGRKIEKATNGINIIDGKKTLVK